MHNTSPQAKQKGISLIFHKVIATLQIARMSCFTDHVDNWEVLAGYDLLSFFRFLREYIDRAP